MPQAKNTSEIKVFNKMLIRDTLLSENILTKKQISELTGLSLATCTSMLAELIDEGIVNELELAEPNGGRPARRFEINADYANIICMFCDINLEQPALRLRVYDYKGRILEEEAHVPNRGIAVGGIRTGISRTLSKYPRTKIIIIGIPGITDENGVIDLCEFSSLMGQNLGKIIEDEFGVKTIVGNDMYFVSNGFYLMSDRPKPFSLTISLWPENRMVASGSVIDGTPLVGATRFAGKISNLPIFAEMSGERHLFSTNKSDISSDMGKYVATVTALIDPDLIVLCGEIAAHVDLEEIKKNALPYIPEKYLPEVILQPGATEEYMTGLYHEALRTLHGETE
ncbi:MAG: winged helix-turn-helix domain-containing protein [Clostridia bacterium]|nr:winged helix-turn-helix domain-containing protein [Clostridia bacterium]